MRSITLKARGLLADLWNVVKIVARVWYHFVRSELADQMGVMILATFGLAFVGGLTSNIVLVALMTLPAFRWGQLSMVSDARIICDECQRELEVVEDESSRYMEVK